MEIKEDRTDSGSICCNPFKVDECEDNDFFCCMDYSNEHRVFYE